VIRLSPGKVSSQSASFSRASVTPRASRNSVRLMLRSSSAVKDFRVENLKHVGWQLFMPATYVNWCGHGQEIADGRVTFVPVLGEAR
jgi:hypothetical protein